MAEMTLFAKGMDLVGPLPFMRVWVLPKNLCCPDYEAKLELEDLKNNVHLERKDSFADKLSRVEDYEKSMIFDFQSNQNQPIHLPK